MIKWLGPSLSFPPVEQSTPEGIVAVGGDLSSARLLLAYRSGIFPWYSAGQPIIWWSPDPRGIIPLEGFRVNRSLKKALRRAEFEIRINTAFDSVITGCASAHESARGPGWLTDEMMPAYMRLHRLGHAHSVEAWKDGQLVGGLYGVAVGGLFAGESMFHLQPNASKAALVALVERLKERGYALLDCQMVTPATGPLGAVEIPRAEYLDRLSEALGLNCVFV
ncbi:MAG: leucyl/phenylalanyl-tRNA--protein transferase [Nitrospirae bacterium]|nr:leucyl/phenylalanyl-tRNA--protein transferase [Nitrospirota bacterium]